MGGLLNLTVQPANHLLKALAEGAQLILLGPDGLPLLQVAAANSLHPGAQGGNGPGDGPAQPESPPCEEEHQQPGSSGNQHKVHHQLAVDLSLEGMEPGRFEVEVVVHILLDEGGEDIDVVLQLALAFVIAVCALELGYFFLQVLTQAEHTGDSRAAVLFGGGGQQLPGQLLGGVDLIQGQALGILAVDDVVIHL